MSHGRRPNKNRMNKTETRLLENGGKRVAVVRVKCGDKQVDQDKALWCFSPDFHQN